MENETPTILLDAMDEAADFDQIKSLIDGGADVNACASDGRGPLVQAVSVGNPELAQLLLEHGADPKAAWNLGNGADIRMGIGFRILTWMLKKYIPETTDTILTPANVCDDPEITVMLVKAGVPVEAFDDGMGENMFPHATGAARIPHIALTDETFNSGATPTFGTSNPERVEKAFWTSQIQTNKSAYTAAHDLLGDKYQTTRGAPVWSFQRFGRSYTELPNGDLVLIAGEHEDHYDADFNIYNDVTILDRKGGVEHFIYPQDVFPPTDFHTATLFEDHILLIGSLGYPSARLIGETQVLRLNLDDYSIEQVKTHGQNPGWISNHKASVDGTNITISDGMVQTAKDYVEQTSVFSLDTTKMEWSKIS